MVDNCRRFFAPIQILADDESFFIVIAVYVPSTHHACACTEQFQIGFSFRKRTGHRARARAFAFKKSTAASRYCLLIYIQPVNSHTLFASIISC